MSRRRYRARPSRGPGDTPRPLLKLFPESMDLDANAVARHEGKIVFIRGALAREQVTAEVIRSKPRFDVAQTVSIERESTLRVRPRCPHFEVCGGCSMQHLAPSGQLAVKQRALEDQLKHLGGLRAEQILRPLAGPDWGYRYRARLSVRHVVKKGGVLVGFHERGSGFVADMRECHVLPSQVSDLLIPLRELIIALDMRDRMPQIEVAVAQNPRRPDGTPTPMTIALVFRILDPVSPADHDRLAAFVSAHRVQLWLQPKGPDTIEPFDPADRSLSYALTEFDLHMPFLPTDFTQVNHQINASMVGQAVRLLGIQPGEIVGDLFCGLGNFSLPMARRGAQVVGIEGAASLCERAEQAARDNGLASQARFEVADLFQMTVERWRALGPFDRLLIDPPREGAAAVVAAIVASDHRPARIVYVSCNPATLARDASILVHQGGYRLTTAGIVNMFPHTSHVESMACFERADTC